MIITMIDGYIVEEAEDNDSDYVTYEDLLDMHHQELMVQYELTPSLRV